jgi:hypothetical protein
VRELRKLGAILLLTGITACTSTGCDPTRAGLIESMQCDSNGGYQQRTTFLQNGLSGAQANAAYQGNAAYRAGEDARAAQRDLATRRQELSRLDSRLAEIRRRVAALPQGNPSAQQMTVEVQQVEYRRTTLSTANPDDAALRDLDARETHLLRALSSY